MPFLLATIKNRTIEHESLFFSSWSIWEIKLKLNYFNVCMCLNSIKFIIVHLRQLLCHDNKYFIVQFFPISKKAKFEYRVCFTVLQHNSRSLLDRNWCNRKLHNQQVIVYKYMHMRMSGILYVKIHTNTFTWTVTLFVLYCLVWCTCSQK